MKSGASARGGSAEVEIHHPELGNVADQRFGNGDMSRMFQVLG
jgi:hypothetical protein